MVKESWNNFNPSKRMVKDIEFLVHENYNSNTNLKIKSTFLEMIDIKDYMNVTFFCEVIVILFLANLLKINLECHFNFFFEQTWC